jgi:hypothetical protein
VAQSLLLVATQFTRLHPVVLYQVKHLHRSVIWLLLAAAVLISVVEERAVLERERYP